MSWTPAADHYRELLRRHREAPSAVPSEEWLQVAAELDEERRRHPVVGRIHQEEGHHRMAQHARSIAKPRPDGHLDSCAQQRCCSSECQFYCTDKNWKPWQW